MSKKNFFVLAYYYFTSIPNPHQEVLNHKLFFQDRNMKSRIYISDQGINGQLSGVREDAEDYMRWLHQNPLFEKVIFKIHTHHENVFPRQTIKYRKQLVALDEVVNMEQTGDHVSPTEWKQMLKEKENKILLDVRNDYEWAVGRFEGAECPPCETFREFKTYADELSSRVDPQKTPVMMYCTGGIRCELYSSLLKEKGFDQVYQLDGGIINYGLKEGSDHWLGKLFVFDDRLTVPISEESTDVIGKCHHCGQPNESYYNCANMNCNHLFLCCPDCLKQQIGCCSSNCQTSARLRPYHEQDAHKPFKKWYHYFNEQKKSA
jgi:UPF0176 protein